MLKLNTVLTALAVVLMAVSGYMLSTALGKIDSTHDTTTRLETKVDAVGEAVADHEKRLRSAEHDVAVLQQQDQISSWHPNKPKETKQ